MDKASEKSTDTGLVAKFNVTSFFARVSEFVSHEKDRIKEGLHSFVVKFPEPLEAVEIPAHWEQKTFSFEHRGQEHLIPVTEIPADKEHAWGAVFYFAGFGSKTPYLKHLFEVLNHAGLDVVSVELPDHDGINQFMPMFNRAMEAALLEPRSPLMKYMDKYDQCSMIMHSTQGQTGLNILADRKKFEKIHTSLAKVILINPFFAPAWASPAYPRFFQRMFQKYAQSEGDTGIGLSPGDFSYLALHKLCGNVSKPISNRAATRKEVLHISQYGEDVIEKLQDLKDEGKLAHLESIDFRMIRGLSDPFSCTRINKYIADTVGMKDIPLSGGHNVHTDPKSIEKVLGEIFHAFYKNHKGVQDEAAPEVSRP